MPKHADSCPEKFPPVAGAIDDDCHCLRNVIAADLDYPFAEEGFALVDVIEANIADLDFEGDPDHHETAAEIADRLTEMFSTRAAANLWAVLHADGKGADLYGPEDTTGRRITLDLFATIESAVHAGLVHTTEES